MTNPTAPPRTRIPLSEGDLAFHDLVVRHVDGLLVVDADGVVRFTNRSAERLLGQPDRPLVGHSFELPLVLDKPIEVEVEIDVDARSSRVVELRATSIEWQGSPASLVSARDVSDKASAEQEATLLARLMEDIASAADVSSALESALRRLGVHTGWAVAEAWLPHPDGRTLRLAASWSEPSEELVSFREESARYRIDPVTALEARPWHTGEALWLPTTLTDADTPRGRLIEGAGLGSAMAIPVAGEDGVTGVLVFFAREPQDDDEGSFRLVSAVAAQLGAAIHRRRIEEALAATAAELERRNAELERSNADLSEFASIVSHDLRQPLTIMTGYLQTLTRVFSDRLPEDAIPLVEGATDAGERMGMLISDLLAYARVGTEPLDAKRFDCTELVESIVAALGPAIEESAGRVRIADLPTVHGDAQQLGQVFTNLIANALKFTKPGEPPEVEVTGETLPDLWCLRVIDNGVGVPEEERSKVFEMFSRLDSRYPGTGIGLAICRRVVERHGGRIWIEASDAGGSAFWVTIPRPLADAQA